ncbi:2639_t:CDS:2 [Scutellospora calospora]|uniref:2639_t:CDS:1 n=1 Tax=Scutellospora calospora TaxID=85575 RepID=A0ACA9K316_9GLOM|nr:2639_t:CDS:2 [Scutellospora calospora]
MNDQSEKLINKVGTINEIRKIANENDSFKEDLTESLKASISLVCDVFSHQFLKSESFEIYNVASDIEIENPSAARAKNIGITAIMKKNINKEVNEEKNDSTESESSDDEKPDEIAEESDENIEEPDTVAKNSIYELFLKVFVNDSLTCTTEIEKPYYSARIYPDVCIHCGCLDISNSENEYPHCNDYESNLTNLKKSSRQSKDIKNIQKHIKTKN